MTTPNETAQRILDRITTLGQSDPVRPRLSLDVQRLAVAVGEELERMDERLAGSHAHPDEIMSGGGTVKRGRRRK